MYIVLGDEAAKFADKYLIFELDTIRVAKDVDPIKSFCVIDSESVALTEMMNIDRWQNLHSKLLENYKKRNWSFCEQAIEHLKGKFKGEMDTFYDHLEARINTYKEEDPPKEWDGVLDKT